MTYPGSGGPWQPNDPNQQPGSGPFPAQPGYPQQQGGYSNPQSGGFPQLGGYYQQPGQGYPQTGPQPAQGYGYPQTGPQPTMQQYGPPGYPEPPGKKSRKGLIIGAIVAVIAIAAGSVVTVWALNRSDVKAGAPSPTAAADLLVNAISKGDLAGLLASLSPSEAAVLVDLNKDLTEEFKRLEVYKPDADPSSIQGANVKTTDLKYDDGAAEKVNDHLTITKLVGGKLSIDSDASKLPFTDRFLEAAFPRGLNSKPEHEEVDIAQATDNGKRPIRIATVKVNNQWYPSLFYTIADYGLQADKQDWPKEPIANNGTGSATDAVKEFAQATADRDLKRLIELLPPDEMGVLHDVGPVILDQAKIEGDNPGIKITKFDADTQDVTAGKKVVVKDLEADADGGHHLTVRRDGDCYSYQADDENGKFCADQVTATLKDGNLSPEAKNALVHLASGMLKNTGIVTTQVDGKWYVSPLRSFTDIELTVFKSLSADDFYALLKVAK